ncbi:hypothetical protein ACTXT7_007854, partial [Hymenolepis weldensis]
AKIPPDISNTSTTTVSPSSYNNPTQSLVVAVSSKALRTAAPVQATNDDTKLHSSLRDSVQVTNLTYSIELSMPQVVTARRVSEPTVPKQ